MKNVILRLGKNKVKPFLNKTSALRFATRAKGRGYKVRMGTQRIGKGKIYYVLGKR